MDIFLKYAGEIDSFINDKNRDILTIVTRYNYAIIHFITTKYKVKTIAFDEEEKNILNTDPKCNSITLKEFINQLYENTYDPSSKNIIFITDYDERIINIRIFLNILIKNKNEQSNFPKVILLSHNQNYVLGTNAIKIDFHTKTSEVKFLEIDLKDRKNSIISKIRDLKETRKNIVIFTDSIGKEIKNLVGLQGINIISKIDDKIDKEVSNIFILTWKTKYLIKLHVISYIIDMMMERNEGDFIFTSRYITQERILQHADFINIKEAGIQYLVNELPYDKFEKPEEDLVNITRYVRELITYNINPASKEIFGEKIIKYIELMNDMNASLYLSGVILREGRNFGEIVTEKRDTSKETSRDYYDLDLSLISCYLLTNFKHSKLLLLFISILENDITYIVKNENIFDSNIEEIKALSVNNSINDIQLLLYMFHTKLDNNAPKDSDKYFKYFEMDKVLNTYTRLLRYVDNRKFEVIVYNLIDSINNFVKEVTTILIPFVKIVQLYEKKTYVDVNETDWKKSTYQLPNNLFINKYKYSPMYLMVLKDKGKNVIQLSMNVPNYRPEKTIDSSLIGEISPAEKERLKYSLIEFNKEYELEELEIFKLSENDRYKFLEARNFLNYSYSLDRVNTTKVNIILTQEERKKLESLL